MSALLAMLSAAAFTNRLSAHLADTSFQSALTGIIGTRIVSEVQVACNKIKEYIKSFVATN